MNQFFPVYANETDIFDYPMIDFELQRSKLILISFHGQENSNSRKV